MRLAKLSICLLPLFLIGAAFKTAPGGTTDCTKTMQPGDICYARMTSGDNTASAKTGQCSKGVKVKFVCNIANAADFDCSVTVSDCPEGVSSGAQCLPILNPLTGAPNLSTIYGVTSPNTVLGGTIGASQTAEAELTCF